jgi:hypothetical protein
MECYVGLDVHSKASVFVIRDGRGQVIAQGEMPTTPEGCRRWYDAQQLPGGTPVALETGTVAFFVARELTALECAPSVIDAREVRLEATEATRLGLALPEDHFAPSRYGTGHSQVWERLVDGRRALNALGIRELREAIAAEQWRRREPWIATTSTVVGIIGAWTGLLALALAHVRIAAQASSVVATTTRPTIATTTTTPSTTSSSSTMSRAAWLRVEHGGEALPRVFLAVRRFCVPRSRAAARRTGESSPRVRRARFSSRATGRAPGVRGRHLRWGAGQVMGAFMGTFRILAAATRLTH